MKIKLLFQPNEEITIESYLKKHGVENPEKFLKPDKSCLEPLDHYEGMEQGWEMIKELMQ